MNIIYRPGEARDCPAIAEIIHTASGGVVEFMLHGLVPGVTPVQLVAQNLAKDAYPRTYRSTIVAVDSDTVVGAAFSYPFSYHRLTEEMQAFVPADRLAHVESLFSACADSGWYLDALGVSETHRRRGIGTELIVRTQAKAVEMGHPSVSLFAFADNAAAIPLYERHGFRKTRHIPLAGNHRILHDGGCWMMECPLG